MKVDRRAVIQTLAATFAMLRGVSVEAQEKKPQGAKDTLSFGTGAITTNTTPVLLQMDMSNTVLAFRVIYKDRVVELTPKEIMDALEGKL